MRIKTWSSLCSGEVIEDIIDAYKEIENMKLELTKLFINEVIIPLESRAEIEINNMKVNVMP